MKQKNEPVFLFGIPLQTPTETVEEFVSMWVQTNHAWFQLCQTIMFASAPPIVVEKKRK